MKTYIPIFLIFLFPLMLLGQEVDSLAGDVRLREVVVTATKTSRKTAEIPVQTTVISQQQINQFPLSNIDDILKTSADVYVNRSWGIFSKNAAVTMRGLESSDRVLVLVDGIPKNRMAGGSVNWHNINPDMVDRIEIIKGPASALYGTNAMAGVINIITKQNTEKLEGSARIFYGSHSTIGSSLTLSGKEKSNQKGFYYGINGFFRKGDGYIFEAPEYIDETDVKTALNEKGGGINLGYRFNEKSNIELVFDTYDEKRGAGREVFATDGSFDAYLTNNIRLTANNTVRGWKGQTSVYFSEENYYGQKESLNETNEYRLLDAYTDRLDMGLISNWSKRLGKNHHITLGAEVKAGSLKAHDIYRTSPDELKAAGKSEIYGLFLQDEISLFQNRLEWIVGIRGDYASFHDGWQQVINPTKTTGFSTSFYENFNTVNWSAISPKTSVQYRFNGHFSVYASVGTGFKPAKLKDLCQSGKINKGFRLANPNVTPEFLTNYEVGFHYKPHSKINLSSAFYYSKGKDFQYSIGTGDSIDTGGSSLKPVIITDNVAQVSVLGAEISVNYQVTTQLHLQISYSYNNSEITDYHPSLINPSLNLKGKKMIEVPPQLLYAGVNWTTRYFLLQANCSYVDQQWYDVENTIRINSWLTTNVHLAHPIKDNLNLYIDIQDLFDNVYIDRKGQLSPGRFITAGIQFNFHK